MRINRTSRLFIRVLFFRAFTEGPASLLEFLFFEDSQKVPLVYSSFCFSGVNRRSCLFIGVFVFGGLTEGPACLLEFLFFRGLTEGPAC